MGLPCSIPYDNKLLPTIIHGYQLTYDVIDKCPTAVAAVPLTCYVADYSPLSLLQHSHCQSETELSHH